MGLPDVPCVRPQQAPEGNHGARWIRAAEAEGFADVHRGAAKWSQNLFQDRGAGEGFGTYLIQKP